MVLSQRERYIAVGLGAVLVLLILWQVVYSPLENWSSQISTDKANAIKERDDTAKLFKDQVALLKVWDEMQKAGLQNAPGDAQNKLGQAVTEWAMQSGVSVSNWKANQTTMVDPKAGFVAAGVQATCSGTTSGIAKLLYQIEVAKIPARLHGMTISSKKEGTDDLTVILDLSTLCLVPPTQVSPAPTPALSTAAKTDDR
ncbi:MAG TPA: type II secretion system protein GspM [Tepidisphaeraceae bacterium]